MFLLTYLLPIRNNIYIIHDPTKGLEEDSFNDSGISLLEDAESHPLILEEREFFMYSNFIIIFPTCFLCTYNFK